MTPTEQFDLVLGRYAHIDRIRPAVLAMLGVDHPDAANLVVAHAEDSDDVLAVYTLTVGWFGVYETNTAGDELLVCVPVERISRIAEERRGAVTVRVVIEIDADRTVTTSRPDGDANVGQIVRAFYELRAPGCEVFAANARAYLNQ